MRCCRCSRKSCSRRKRACPRLHVPRVFCFPASACAPPFAGYCLRLSSYQRHPSPKWPIGSSSMTLPSTPIPKPCCRRYRFQTRKWRPTRRHRVTRRAAESATPTVRVCLPPTLSHGCGRLRPGGAGTARGGVRPASRLYPRIGSGTLALTGVPVDVYPSLQRQPASGPGIGLMCPLMDGGMCFGR